MLGVGHFPGEDQGDPAVHQWFNGEVQWWVLRPTTAVRVCRSQATQRWRRSAAECVALPWPLRLVGNSASVGRAGASPRGRFF